MASANSPITIPSNQSPLLLLNNMSNLMSTKLDSSNYMIWKLQITVVLDAYSMLEHLDGSIPKPNQFLTTRNWNSSCESRFSGNETVSTYLQRIKTMRDKFSAVGVHSDHEELIHVILKGLPKEYAPFASAIRTRDTILPLEKLSVLLQTEEQSMSEATESLSNSALAMFVSHNKPSFNGNHGFNRGRGRNSYSRGRNGGGRNYNQGFSSLNTSTPHYQQQQYQQQQISPPAQQASHTTFQSKNERPTCQICWKMGHYAIDCYHRMNFAYQGKNPTTKLAAMASASNLQYTQNAETWLTDTGATDHITANASNLSHQSPYQGQEQVSVGNGQGLPIQNIVLLQKLYKNTVITAWQARCISYLSLLLIKQLTSPFELIHADLWGPAPVVASNSFSHNSLVISPTSHESSPIPPGQCPLHTASVPVPITDPTATYSSSLSTAPIPDHTAPYSSPLPTASIPDHTAEFNVPLLSHIPLPTGFTNNPTPIPTSLPTNPIPNLHSDTVPLSDNTHSTDMPLPHTHLPLAVPHPMQTRSKSGIVKPKLTYAALIDYALTEPTSYTVASKHSSWCTAMDEEFQALQKQGTWSLVPLPPSKNVARLVAKGFHQQHGIDFTETFSPVIKPPTVRLILSLAVSLNWPLRQLDVKNAFLHGTLKEEVYMTQPQGYIDPIHPQYVCKLQKSIYGLKQAPRAWFESFTTQLLHLGFIASTADSSLFIYKEHKVIAYLLLYVDDIVLTSNTPAFLDTLIHKLSSVFDLKDLGSLHYFLGLQVTRTPSRLYINQAKYAQDLLKKHNMLDCKPASSPSCPNTRLSLHDGDPLPDPHAYRSMVGALHYLTFTRPDISFAVHQVCQYMSTPTTTHLAAAKRVLRYIRGTFNHGIEFTPGPLSLSAYTDADWAGDPDDRRSTYGFLVYLGHNAITWSAKKQATVSRSSTESEYRALAIALLSSAGFVLFLKTWAFISPDPPTLWCDNISALAIASNPVFHARTKHIEVDFHFVRERVLRKDLLVKFVSTVDQLADIFTKSLSTHRFLELRRNLTVPVPKIEGG
uniref:Reverse transcriptase Ty1/copia-type domain-containing protein n=1 Tax=Fagus sylvatica TaxID=28930 RepID=A0A2N9GUG0_FAGSY